LEILPTVYLGVLGGGDAQGVDTGGG
jgi:hypothetical protein